MLIKNIVVGYSGSGVDGDCSDIDECGLPDTACQANSHCVNSEGSYTCECDTVSFEHKLIFLFFSSKFSWIFVIIKQIRDSGTWLEHVLTSMNVQFLYSMTAKPQQLVLILKEATFASAQTDLLDSVLSIAPVSRERSLNVHHTTLKVEFQFLIIVIKNKFFEGFIADPSCTGVAEGTVCNVQCDQANGYFDNQDGATVQYQHRCFCERPLDGKNITHFQNF